MARPCAGGHRGAPHRRRRVKGTTAVGTPKPSDQPRVVWCANFLMRQLPLSGALPRAVLARIRRSDSNAAGAGRPAFARSHICCRSVPPDVSRQTQPRISRTSKARALVRPAPVAGAILMYSTFGYLVSFDQTPLWPLALIILSKAGATLRHRSSIFSQDYKI